MQTFLPLPSFSNSLVILDRKRLGKQRVEARQIFDTLQKMKDNNRPAKIAWENHPAVRMWENYEEALKYYHDLAIHEWARRGYNNTMPLLLPSKTVHDLINMPKFFEPWWFGNHAFHASHRSNLLRKDYGFYSKNGWTEPPTLPYWWPTKNIKVYTNSILR